LSHCRTLDELPPNARAYISRLEQLCQARISAIGIGPNRTQTITLRTPPFGSE
ncbi:MAG: adenylosuccinate synthetase, partial [Pseudonocardiaceae bacterium]